ncbi:N-acetylmuramoyl-L-alanine amidase [Chitinophaga nivalis]|uniref:N-acetylmuramoyl-L-alanine amidase n=1 Tax=Chitinophaga nivalis TaxID=2991709 RepID=A0ABT3IW16_9BACT|nr:N-acetylmuramoyl-L-alanine amidase [Chitinophaga nivalis]MCW3462132.1 N-acetylmuramoyl-L-alanine amidase [Chitinophaga nivalis]MCW3488176.1 N-acetylmuramoyl-L-alanine amidase [Chitinophaga nivalis]
MKPSVQFFLQFFFALSLPFLASGQASIRLNQPAREQNNVNTGKQFIAGRTCTGCKVRINNDTVHVYSTNTFAVRYDLPTGRSTFTITAEDPNGETYTKNITYYYNPSPAPAATSIFRIDFAEVSPSGNVQLSAGDTLRVKMKGYPGAAATWFDHVPLLEMPAAQTGGVPGYYSGYYVIQPADSLLNGKLRFTLRNQAGETAVLNSTYRYTVMRNDIPLTGRTLDKMTYLTASPHGDRLGPDKIGYLDKDVLLQVSGKQGDYYKVRLSSKTTAFIPEPLLDTEIPQEHPSISIATDAKIWGDEKSDYVSVALSDKLPYLSSQSVSPGKIIVDIHGAYSEQGLNTLLQNTREITSVAWQQPTHDVLRMIISLKHMPWGYQVYYEGNRITVKVKRVPERLSLRGLTIGLDPGHGGGNPGASGLTGASEKQLTLILSMQLKAALEREGATVIATRTTDRFVANEERLSFFRQINPDILLSIHLNSSANPVDAHGTATYYKHTFCEPLNAAIHRRLVETGLRDFGNNNGFNFILNNPTEFPDALVETLFLSNPGDEEKVLDPAFQQKMVEKIVLGIKDYLQRAAQ